MNYGARLKSARKAAGMTQTALAKAAGLKGQSLIGNLETGGQQGTTFNSIKAGDIGITAKRTPSKGNSSIIDISVTCKGAEFDPYGGCQNRQAYIYENFKPYIASRID